MSDPLKIRSRIFAKDVILLCRRFPHDMSAREIARQVIRSSASIGANIAEARGSGTQLEFARYYRIALKSTNETIYWLELVGEMAFVRGVQLEPLLNEAVQLGRMLGAAVLTMRKKSRKC